MKKSPDAFRTISEVAEWLDVPTHVLRFWESRFSQIKPVKRAGGRRYYRPSDMRLIGGVKVLLHDQGMTIRSVQKMLREQGIKHVASFSPPLEGEEEDGVDLPEVIEHEEALEAAAMPAPPSAAARTTHGAAPAAEPPLAETAPEPAVETEPETAPAAAEPEAADDEQFDMFPDEPMAAPDADQSGATGASAPEGEPMAAPDAPAALAEDAPEAGGEAEAEVPDLEDDAVPADPPPLDDTDDEVLPEEARKAPLGADLPLSDPEDTSEVHLKGPGIAARLALTSREDLRAHRETLQKAREALAALRDKAS